MRQYRYMWAALLASHTLVACGVSDTSNGAQAAAAVAPVSPPATPANGPGVAPVVPGDDNPPQSPTPTDAPFDGNVTVQAAFFEPLIDAQGNGIGNTVYLLSESATCAQWQDPNYVAAQNLNYMQLDVLGNAAGSYALAPPGQAAAQQGDAYYTGGETHVTSSQGAATVTAINPNTALDASVTVTWSDTHTSTIAPFAATYCPAPAVSFAGAFAVKSALFSGGDGTNPLVIVLLSQPATCAQWQDPSFDLALSSFALNITVNGTTAGTFNVVAPDGGLDANQASAHDAAWGNVLNSASGSVALSQFNPGTTAQGQATLTWDDGEVTQVGNFTATYCP